MKTGRRFVVMAMVALGCFAMLFLSGCKRETPPDSTTGPTQIPDAPYATAQQMEQVAVSKTASAGGAVTAHPGGRITYTVSVTNNNADPISVTVTDTLPEKTLYISGCSNVSGNELRFDVKNIAPGQTASVSYQVQTDYTLEQIRTATEPVILSNTPAKVMEVTVAAPADIYISETFNAADRRRMEMAIDSLVTANLTAYNSSMEQLNGIPLASMMYNVGFSTGLGMPTDLDEILTLIYEKNGQNTDGGSAGTGEENAVAASNLLARVAPTLYGGTGVPADKDALFRGQRATSVSLADLVSGDLVIVSDPNGTRLYIFDGLKLVALDSDKVDTNVDSQAVLAGLPASERYVVLRPSVNLNTHYSLETDEAFNEADKAPYTELEQALVKTAEAYLLRGDRTQYTDDNTGHALTRAESLVKQPEDYTVDQYGYTNCAQFTFDVHWATYGFAAKAATGNGSSYLSTTLNLLDSAKLDWNAETLTGKNKSTVFYYECPTEIVDDKVVSTLTEAEKTAIQQQYYDLLRPGDVICYRYHPSRGSSGHAMLYVGNGLIIHSSGSSYSTKNQTDTHEASIRFMAVSELFDQNISTSRYMFTHERFAIIRPQNLTLARITGNTQNRVNNMEGVIAEKVSSTHMAQTVNAGDEITFTFYIFNTNPETKHFQIKDTVSGNATFVSATDGGVLENGSVTWEIDVPADTRIGVSYTVKVNEGLNRFARIDGTKATINGVSHKCYHTYVANTLTQEQQQKVVDAVKTVKGMNVSGLSSVQIADLIYETAFGTKNIFGENVKTYAQLFNGNGKNNVGIFNDTTYWSDPKVLSLMDSNTSNGALMVAPGLYGGLNVYSSSESIELLYRFTTFNNQALRSRYYREEDLVVGDLYLLRGNTQESLYIYIGNDTFVSLGQGHTLFSEISATKRLQSTPDNQWKYHAVLRPSFVLDLE